MRQNGSGDASDVCEKTQCDYVNMTMCTCASERFWGCQWRVRESSMIMLTWLCVPCASEWFWGCQWRVRESSMIMLTWLCVPCASEWFWGCQWRVAGRDCWWGPGSPSPDRALPATFSALLRSLLSLLTWQETAQMVSVCGLHWPVGPSVVVRNWQLLWLEHYCK